MQEDAEEAWGGEIDPDLLMHAYASGVFPMSEHRDDPEIFWVDPVLRGVIPLDGFHISRSLAKAIRRADYEVTFDADFEGVLRACADRTDTWISAEIHRLYMALHARGQAHSIEVWRAGRLIGGVYGVVLGRAFFGESMFSRERDASKIALAWLVDHLRRCGFVLFDTQFLTPHLASLGAIEIPRAAYRAALAEAIESEADFYSVTPDSASALLQRSTQTS